MSNFTPSVNPGIRESVDALGRPSITAQMKARINAEFATIESGKRGALVIFVDESGVARAHLAARLGKTGNWKVAAGGGVPVKRPREVTGFFGVIGSW